MVDPFSLLVVTALTFLLAGFVKGVIGLGLPTIAMGLLVLAMAPLDAAALLVVPALVTNVWQAAAGPNLAGIVARLWPMMLAILVGTWAAMWGGIGLLTDAAADHAITVLGVVLLLYALSGLTAVRMVVSAHSEPWMSPLAGATTGIVTATTGVAVMPSLIYLRAIGLEKDDLVQALGLTFAVANVGLGIALALGGVFEVSVAGGSAVALAASLGGMALGQRVRSHASPDVFRRYLLLGLFALGGYLALRGMA